jgi:hypothetical protein
MTDPSGEKEPQANGSSERQPHGTSKAKVITVGVVIALIVMTVMIVLFTVLSSGFDSFSRRAAQVFVPQETPASSPADTTDEAKKTEKQEQGSRGLPTAPGL